MKQTDYKKMYDKIFKVMGELTPLKADCGRLCSGACCKGDANTGMRLFPLEETRLPYKELPSGVRLVVCNGSCNREERPLACRIFPFFPTIDEKGRVYTELDYRGTRVCPMIEHSSEIIFDRRFLRSVRKVGRILAKDPVCREFLLEATQEIDTYSAFLGDE